MSWIIRRIKRIGLFGHRPGPPNPTYVQMFLSYLAVAALVLLVATIVLYSAFAKRNISEVKKITADMLAGTSSTTNLLRNWIMPFALQLRDDPIILRLTYGTNYDPMFLNTAYIRLSQAVSSTPLIQSIFVYNSREQMVYSTANTPERIDKCCDSSLLPLLRRMESRELLRFIPRRLQLNINKRRYTTNVLTLIVGETPQAGTSMGGALIINLEADQVRQLFMRAEQNREGMLMILDESGLVISSTDNRLFARNLSGVTYIQRILRDNQPQGFFSARVNRDDSLVSYAASELGWRLISITPYRLLFGSIYWLRNMTVAIGLVILLISALLSMAVARRIYSPIGQLAQLAAQVRASLTAGGMEGGRGARNELQYTSEVLSQAADRVNSLGRLLENNEGFHRQELIKVLLAGHIQPSEADLCWDHLGNTIRKDDLAVAVLRFDGYRRLAEVLDMTARRNFRRVLSELAGETIKAPCEIVDMEPDHIVLIAQLEQTRPGLIQASMESQLRSIQNLISERLGLTITIGVGPAAKTPAELGTAYGGALLATQYRFRQGANAYIVYDAAMAHPAKGYRFPEDKAQTLMEMLRLGKKEQVESIMEEILDTATGFSYEDFALAVQLLSYMSRKTFQEIVPARYHNQVNLKQIQDRLDFAETVADAGAAFRDFYAWVLEASSMRRHERKQEVLDNIVHYITQHLHDPGLSVEGLAAAVNVSPSTLRSLFKEALGKSPSDYICEQRLKKAKEMLLITKLAVKVIAGKVGFSSYEYFSTVFRKYTGQTPREYRLAHRKAQSS